MASLLGATVDVWVPVALAVIAALQGIALALISAIWRVQVTNEVNGKHASRAPTA